MGQVKSSARGEFQYLWLWGRSGPRRDLRRLPSSWLGGLFPKPPGNFPKTKTLYPLYGDARAKRRPLWRCLLPAYVYDISTLTASEKLYAEDSPARL